MKSAVVLGRWGLTHIALLAQCWPKRGLCWSREGGQMRWFDGVAAWSPTNRIDLAGRRGRGEGWGVLADKWLHDDTFRGGGGEVWLPLLLLTPQKGGGGCRVQRLWQGVNLSTGGEVRISGRSAAAVYESEFVLNHTPAQAWVYIKCTRPTPSAECHQIYCINTVIP
jgi:hypothetical protein